MVRISERSSPHSEDLVGLSQVLSSEMQHELGRVGVGKAETLRLPGQCGSSSLFYMSRVPPGIGVVCLPSIPQGDKARVCLVEGRTAPS